MSALAVGCVEERMRVMVVVKADGRRLRYYEWVQSEQKTGFERDERHRREPERTREAVT